MSDGLAERAEAAGVAARWRDVHGEYHDVPAATLQAVLDALGPSTEEQAPLITADIDAPIVMAGQPGPFRITLEDGTAFEGLADDAGDGRIRLPPIDRDGYHRLEIAKRETTLAVAPSRCWTIAEATAGRKVWGPRRSALRPASSWRWRPRRSRRIARSGSRSRQPRGRRHCHQPDPCLVHRQSGTL